MTTATLTSIYSIATSISTPLALGGFVSALFFGLTRNIVESLKETFVKISGKDAVKILLRIVTYGFVLSLIAIIGAIGGFGIQYGLKDYIEKQSALDGAREAKENRFPDEIIRNANIIITRWPNDTDGYRLRGAGFFQKKDYMRAVADFQKVIDILPPSLSECDIQNVHAKTNLAAALGAGGDPKRGYDLIRTVKNCDLEKTDLFNYGKLATENNDLAEASRIFGSDKMQSDSRPDIRSKVYIEQAIVEILYKRDGWNNRAIRHLKMALCLEPDIKPLLINSNPSGKNDLSGTFVEEYGFEIRVLSNNSLASFHKSLTSELTAYDPCEATH